MLCCAVLCCYAVLCCGFTNNKKSGVITFNEPNADTLIFNSGIGFSKKILENVSNIICIGAVSFEKTVYLHWVTVYLHYLHWRGGGGGPMDLRGKKSITTFDHLNIFCPNFLTFPKN